MLCRHLDYINVDVYFHFHFCDQRVVYNPHCAYYSTDSATDLCSNESTNFIRRSVHTIVLANHSYAHLNTDHEADAPANDVRGNIQSEHIAD